VNNETLNNAAKIEHYRALKKYIKDEDLRKKLTPTYKFGCKRVLKSDDYLPAFAEPHVELVTDAIDRVTSGISWIFFIVFVKLVMINMMAS
jgi:cation diffusion facilitator CzcD-associated flavoprotein CzcO